MRKLTWHENLGKVDIELTFDNGTFNFKCLPIHAILINIFDEDKMDSNKLKDTEVAKICELNVVNVIQKMSFWVHTGVIIQEEINENIYYYPVKNYQGY